MLTQRCDTLTGVGPQLAKKLTNCGIHTLQDLILHLPLRYQDRTHITPLCDLRPHDFCVIEGRVCKVELKQGKRAILTCYIEDLTGIIKLRFFHFNRQQVALFHTAPTLRAFGEVRHFSQQFEMVHPEYQIIDPHHITTVPETLTPIYPSTQGLSQSRLRQIIQQALKILHNELHLLEWMTVEQLHHHHLPSFALAVAQLHNPPPEISPHELENGTHPALKRLIIDELIAHQLSMQHARIIRAQNVASILPAAPDRINHFLASLPFQITGAQKRVYQDISHDLNQKTPMLRLVQGDVGSGKTVIAAMAALQAIHHGYQVALMAPTDLLTEQHAHNIRRWFEPLGIQTAQLRGKMKAKERRETLQALAEGTLSFVVGTHALFQKDVYFQNLKLIIIDEQHRFGVEQRFLFQQKGQQETHKPHQLLMTATPIPRTLAMTYLAHLDLSIIDELPPGRTPVITAVISEDKREQVIEKLRAALASGRQAYWVCTLIDESESLNCTNATAHAQKLQEQCPAARIGLVHGRLKPAEKEKIMGDFKRGDLDLLVATTVIEVGVDVPNASLMIIDNAERLGLSQLHQLRGRVGRGNTASHCLLLYQTPLSKHGVARLRMMRETSDGFLIAEKDLELRGSGEILGTRQTGEAMYKIAHIQRDADLLEDMATWARQILHTSPELAKTLAERWRSRGSAFLQT